MSSPSIGAVTGSLAQQLQTARTQSGGGQIYRPVKLANRIMPTLMDQLRNYMKTNDGDLGASTKLSVRI